MTHTPFDVRDVLQAINDVSDSDFSAFFDAYIEGAEAMPDIAHHLSKTGLAVDQYGDEFYARRSIEPTPERRLVYRAAFERDW